MNRLDEILAREKPGKQDLIFLLSLTEREEINKVFKTAELARNRFCGPFVHLRGIIEFSNYCIQNCNYCGIRKDTLNITRYRLSHEEIIELAGTISNLGIRTIVLQSGEDPYYTTEMMSAIIRSIKQQYDCAITLSLGEREFYEYDEWYGAGADRYLLKHESANPNLYNQIHNGQSLSERIRHLEHLKSIGYQTGSGNIIGLPGQTIEDIADDIILCGELDLDMASFSPFIPAANTPLASVPKAPVQLTLLAMAAARLYLKNVHIPATTALATLDAMGREKGLMCGANVIMPSFTPGEHRKDYSIYDNKRCVTEDPLDCLPCLQVRIEGTGVTIATGKGDSLKLPVSDII